MKMSTVTKGVTSEYFHTHTHTHTQMNLIVFKVFILISMYFLILWWLCFKMITILIQVMKDFKSRSLISIKSYCKVVSPLSCVSCVPASCVHIWFV